MLSLHVPVTFNANLLASFVLALFFTFPVSMIMLQVVPLQFLHALFSFLGDSFSYDSPSSIKSPLASRPPSCYPGIDTPSEGLVRWQLRLEYFAYETLQDLRIGKLFEIIVDYPERYVFVVNFLSNSNCRIYVSCVDLFGCLVNFEVIAIGYCQRTKVSGCASSII